jgi:signal transduction histidine kinase/DNA-binding response OmpR family regulator/streptogramin lyase
MITYLSLSGNETDPLYFHHITANNGLKHNGITSIIQDHKGFMWFASENGLHRFDGTNMKIYMHDSTDSTSLSGNVIYGILEDGRQNLWIASNSGFNKYNRNEGNFIRIGLLPDTNPETKIIYDYYVPATALGKNGEIYVSRGNHGIYKYHTKKKILVPLPVNSQSNERYKLGNIIEMHVDSDNRLWMGSKSEGLFLYDPDKQYTIHYKAGLPGSVSSNFIYAIQEDKYNRILVANEGGLDIYNKKTKSFDKFIVNKNNGSDLEPKWIWNMKLDKDSNMWLCSNRSGLFKVIDKEFNTIYYYPDETNPGSLNDNNIQCFFEDRQGNYWIGAQKGGINYTTNNNTQVFKTLSRDIFKKNTLSNNKITAIIENKDSVIYIGTDGGGLNAFDRKSNQYLSPDQINYPIKPSDDAVLTLYLDSAENLWTGGFLTGLSLYENHGTKKITWKNTGNTPYSLGNNDVRDIFEDSKGNFWVTTNGGGLNLFNRKTGKFRRFTHHESANSISSDFTITITEDSKGYLWLGTYEGLDRIDPDNFEIKNYSHNHSLTGDWIYSLLIDSKDQLWVGTNMAIHKYDEINDIFLNYNDSIDLPNEIVTAILEDDQKNLWISTSAGLASYNTSDKTTSQYEKDDGLPGNAFNPGAAFKNKDGLLFFGTSEGLVYFDPSQITTNHQIPPVYITDVSYAPETNKEHHVNSGETIVLDHKQAASVIFNFCALNYINPQKNNYAYQLEGIDEQWHYAGNQKFATYTNLSPGEYRFRVKASNNDNVWNEEGDYIYLSITPPFWKTNAAYILYSLAIILLFTLIWRYTFLRTSYAHKLKIQRLKAEKAEEIARLKTDFFINISHELSTPLTLILAPVEKLIKTGENDRRLLHIIRKNALSLMKLINELLDTQKIEEEQKTAEYNYSDIVAFIKDISNEFSELATSNGISLQLSSKLPSVIFPFSPPDLEKIIHNLISNAIKYNNPGGRVDIDLSFEQNNQTPPCKSACIKVSDTGHGIDQESINKVFNRYYRVSDLTNNNTVPHKTGFGIGLYLTKKLVELHKGTIFIDSTPNVGTTFTIKLPYISGHNSCQVNNEESSHSLLSLNEDEPQKTESNKNHNEKPTILVAEDNLEICDLLKILFEDEYHIYFAGNGQEAIEKTEKHIPNLIIADIMMPVMNGIELCKRIKKDFNTSHIPVLMLTALNSGEMMVKGLTTGADDYVSKPFNPDVLLARAKNLIDSRKNLQKKYLTDLKTQPSEMSLSSADELFLNKLNKVIEKNLDDSEYEVENLASELNMSSITLYRKIKSLTGQSVNPFIRAIRLKRAAVLLQTNTMSVTDVAMNVGFNDVKYFRKCFYKQFQKNPSEFLRKKRK